MREYQNGCVSVRKPTRHWLYILLIIRRQALPSKMTSLIQLRQVQTGTKIIDRILILCAKLSIVLCELNVVHVLIVPDSSNYNYFLRLF